MKSPTFPSMNESTLFDSLSDSGWVSELTQYYLNEEEQDELLAVYDLRSHPNRKEFCKAINQQIGLFCNSVVQYHRLTATAQENNGRLNSQKLTTQLRDKAYRFAEQSDKLLAVMADMNARDIDWIFEKNLGHNAITPNRLFDELTALLTGFAHYARTAPVRVERSTLPAARLLVLHCIPIIEHFTGQKVVRELDPETERADGTIHIFMDTLFYHIPTEVKEKLPQAPTSFDKAIREAIEEYRTSIYGPWRPAKRQRKKH